MGLYLDDAHGYNDDKVFSEEGGAFKSAFGESDNLLHQPWNIIIPKAGN